MATAARRVHRKLSDVELVATETTKRLVADRVLNTSSPRKKALDAAAASIVPRAEEDDPRRPISVPVLVPEAAALVGVNGQRDELARMLLVGEESGDAAAAAAAAERQVVVIVGDAGMGKTTLAHEVYRAVGRHFRRRAWVSASENRS
jgi:chromosomal replication initiation ATPase DnaA